MRALGCRISESKFAGGDGEKGISATSFPRDPAPPSATWSQPPKALPFLAVPILRHSTRKLCQTRLS